MERTNGIQNPKIDKALGDSRTSMTWYMAISLDNIDDSGLFTTLSNQIALQAKMLASDSIQFGA